MDPATLAWALAQPASSRAAVLASAYTLFRVLHGYAATARGDPPTHGRAHDHARGERRDRPGQSAGRVVGVSAVGEDVRDAIE